MSRVLRNDFLKWHFSFITLYIATFIVGWLRATHIVFYTLHPWLGLSTVIVPLGVYLFSKNKRLIRQMIKSNFNIKGKPLVKVAKISTQVILIYYAFSIVSGIIMNYGWYTSADMYGGLQGIHGLARFIVPAAVVTHVTARLLIKAKKKKPNKDL